jgi:D-alanyl-D-alanine carboxypeptidase/D-alanyl-D-alanine-endopeptidase (penicillin-binding protein 4)
LIVIALVVSSLRAFGQAPSPPVIAARSARVLELQRSVDRIVATPALERASWGVLVRSLDTDETIYAMNPGKLMTPASALKVVTVAAAAERLGWNYAYETRVVADGAVSGDTLDGNLVIVASGDPSLDRPTLDVWVAQLKALGITRVTGTVLADARAFSGEGLGFGWSWDDLAYYYAAPIAAAQFRENTVDLTLRPGPSAGTPPLYEIAPAGISGLRLDNRMTTGAATATPEFVARRAPGSPVVVLEGVVPAGSRPV